VAKSSVETNKRDEIKVLDVLEKHAKDNIGELGKRCGLSSQKVARIIKNLEKKKIIWGYSAIVDGTLRDFKHYVLLVKRNTVPFDASIKKELILEKLDEYLPGIIRIEDIIFTHGNFDAVITFYTPNLISAKNFVQELSKRVGKYMNEFLILETLFPIRKKGHKNPHIKELIEYL
jgi:DNA-binding Lrp family transcriptional regulator